MSIVTPTFLPQMSSSHFILKETKSCRYAYTCVQNLLHIRTWKHQFSKLQKFTSQFSEYTAPDSLQTFSLYSFPIKDKCFFCYRALIAGGGAPEIELSLRLMDYANSLTGMEQYCFRAFAEALEVIPFTLAENAGLNPITTVTELRNRHAQGEKTAGINVRKVRFKKGIVKSFSLAVKFRFLFVYILYFSCCQLNFIRKCVI